MDHVLRYRDVLYLPTTAAIIGLIAVIFLAAYRTFRGPKRGNPLLPPGPPPEPLLGHYRIVPEDAAFKKYAEWADEYSTGLQSPYFTLRGLTFTARSSGQPRDRCPLLSDLWHQMGRLEQTRRSNGTAREARFQLRRPPPVCHV